MHQRSFQISKNSNKMKNSKIFKPEHSELRKFRKEKELEIKSDRKEKRFVKQLLKDLQD